MALIGTSAGSGGKGPKIKWHERTARREAMLWGRNRPSCCKNRGKWIKVLLTLCDKPLTILKRGVYKLWISDVSEYKAPILFRLLHVTQSEIGAQCVVVVEGFLKVCDTSKYREVVGGWGGSIMKVFPNNWIPRVVSGIVL